jgi:hypothetical protein
VAIDLPEDVRDRLALSLKEFDAPDRGRIGEARFLRIPIAPGLLPLPAVAVLVLKQRGATELPPGDKTACELAFSYSGINCTLALQKFGLRLYVDAEAVREDDAASFASQLIGKLQKGVRLIEKPVLRPLADKQLHDGNVTIANQTGWLGGTYEYFVETARTAFAADVKIVKPKDDQGKGPLEASGILDAITKEMNRSTVGAYNTLAAVSAYFSLLEHKLVLTLPFVGFDPSGGALATFIGDRWGEKIKKVFDLGSDPDASRHYNRLHDIAETYRNTYSHGGFDKEGAAVWVHLPDLGAVPARLSDIREAPHFELFPVDEEDLEEITKSFAEVDEWLRTAKTKYGIRFAEAGLDVVYDEESRRQHTEATADDDEFERYIEATSRMQDDIANFDF